MIKKIGIILLSLLAAAWKGEAQTAYTVSGFVEDAGNGERLGGATVLELKSGKGCVCNAYGFYSFTLPAGKYHFRVDYVGYLAREFSVDLQRDTVAHVNMKNGGLLDEVVVKGTASLLQSAGMSKHRLSLKQVKAMPALLGEADVLKSLTNLPGVNSGTEGMSGFSVRGGSPEQTQILLDGIPVYNVNHAFGYFSVFNGEALQDLTLLKSAVPSRYGGRLSSVLDVTMKEGNMKKYAGHVALSPVAGSVTVEGPIKKDKASFLISARRTWLDALLAVGMKLTKTDYEVGYGFYDLNAKVNWKPDNQNRLLLSFYNGRDGYFVRWKGEKDKDEYRYHWGNISVAGRWNRVINSRMFANFTMYYTQFKYNQKRRIYNSMAERFDVVRSYSSLQEATAKADFDFLPAEKHHIRFGGVVSHKYFAPEMSYQAVASNDSLWRDAASGSLWSAEAYVEDEWQLGGRWLVDMGLRTTALRTQGTYYYSLEPRLSLAFKAGEHTALKASWSSMQQPLHLLINSSQEWNTDLWVPVTKRIKPGRSNLFSLGVTQELPKGWEFSAEGYYNDLRRMIRYKEGIRYLKRKDKSWQDYVYTGKGRACGLDVMLAKNGGRLNGWISYSLSKAERSYDGINEGAWFPFEYDRRHKLNVVANYTFQEQETAKFRKVIALNFTCTSGSRTTIGQQVYPAAPLPWHPEDSYDEAWWESREYISSPNNCRLPTYHHLDVAFHLQNRKARGDSWSLGIYNVYFRQNPSFYFRHLKDHKMEVRKMSLLPFVPCITWSYRF